MMNMTLMMTTKDKHNKRLEMRANYVGFDEFDDHCKHPLMMTLK